MVIGNTKETYFFYMFTFFGAQAKFFNATIFKQNSLELIKFNLH